MAGYPQLIVCRLLASMNPRCRLHAILTRMRTTIAVAALMAAACATPNAGLTSDDAQRAVHDSVLALGRAYRDGDVSGVDAMIARTYVHTNGGGRPSDRAGYIAWNRKRASLLESGEWRVDAYEVSEIEVTIIGPTALVTGRVDARGARDGRPWSSDVRFTNVWVLEDGAWKRAGFHDAPTKAQ